MPLALSLLSPSLSLALLTPGAVTRSEKGPGSSATGALGAMPGTKGTPGSAPLTAPCALATSTPRAPVASGGRDRGDGCRGEMEERNSPGKGQDAGEMVAEGGGQAPAPTSTHLSPVPAPCTLSPRWQPVPVPHASQLPLPQSRGWGLGPPPKFQLEETGACSITPHPSSAALQNHCFTFAWNTQDLGRSGQQEWNWGSPGEALL